MFGDSKGLTVTLPSKIKVAFDEYLLFVGYSRAWVLVVVELHANNMALQLVEFRHETHSTFIHDLEVPEGVNLDTVANIVLDDRRGEAFLIDSSGMLFCISYV
jgi:hypothetical protein